jgi:hypothetical protein
MKMSQQFWLGQLGDRSSFELKRIVLMYNLVTFVDALKHNSTLKSLKVISESSDFYEMTIIHEGTRAIAEALKVNSSLTALNLYYN